MKTAASKGRLTIAQSRRGRRPMRVETMLRKEQEGTLYKEAQYQAFRAGFLDELQKIATANGGEAPWNGDFEKFASSDLVEEYIKQAFGWAGVRQAVGDAGRAVAGGAKAVAGKLTPAKSLATGVLDPSTGAAMHIPMGGQRGLLGGIGKSLEGSGKLLATGPAAHAAGRAGLPAAPGMAARVGGHTLQSVGHHVNHTSTAGLMLNPLGVPLGGAIEGATRGVGHELQRTGSQAAQRVGGALVKHAPKAGLVGEVGAMGGLGAAVHAPLSAAGVLGGHLAPVLSHAGALGHVAQDAVGTAAQKLTGKAVAPLMGHGVPGAHV